LKHCLNNLKIGLKRKLWSVNNKVFIEKIIDNEFVAQNFLVWKYTLMISEGIWVKR